MKAKINEIWSNGRNYGISEATKVDWSSDSNMNNFKEPGVYEIYGERTKNDDNLPINNASSGHSICARLTVLASTLQPANNEICITQFLMLSNRQGGDGNMYYRTYNQNNSPFADGWSVWKKLIGTEEGYIFTNTWKMNQDGGLQTRNVGLNYMVDNGTYSGVYVNSEAIQIDYSKPWNEDVGNGSGKFTTNTADVQFIETFNITTINDYAVAGVVNNILGGQSSFERQICQVKFATDIISGTSSIKKRVYKGNGANYGLTSNWSDWEEISGGGETVVNAVPLLRQAAASMGGISLPAIGSYAPHMIRDGVIYEFMVGSSYTSASNVGVSEIVFDGGKIWDRLISDGWDSGCRGHVRMQKNTHDGFSFVDIEINKTSSKGRNYYKFRTNSGFGDTHLLYESTAL
jgi:hypothetical protein